jgi:diguanylate cyclase (GGDEF)-like protein/PAS domain S-box-containing protein
MTMTDLERDLALKGEIDRLRRALKRERRRTAERHEKDERKYRLVINATAEGFILLDRDQCITEVNRSLLQKLGFTSQQMIGHAIHDFYDKKRIAFYSASPEHLSFEAWFRTADGGSLPLLFNRSVMQADGGGGGDAKGFIVFLTDLTELKNTQNELKKVEGRYRSMVENAVLGIFQSTLTGRIVQANPAYARILGYASPEEVLELRDIRQYYHQARDHERMVTTLLKEHILINYELRMKRHDDTKVWLLANVRLTRSHTGEKLIEGLIVDNSEAKKAAEELRRSKEKFRLQAIHDNLTGLHNTRYMYQALDGLIARSKSDEKPFSLVFMDMDNFKHVVDTYGHLNGSRALQEVAATIKQAIEPPAFGVAYGGDEFVVVLPGLNKFQARRKAEDIRRRMKTSLYLAKAGHQVRLGASFGVATFPDDATDRTQLLALADRAMFRIKERGKDAVGV